MARFETLQEWLDWQEQSHPRVIDLGLQRVADVYRRLGLDNKRPTVTVAGTNGKGSCIAFLEAMYLADGYRVGAYTSPHIIQYNERIRINGQLASNSEICSAFARIDDQRRNTSLSYFEFGTLAALDCFDQADVDVQLLEVGLGGRLDAVNIVDANAAILTTVAFDHVDLLGNTLEAIGKEKAGVFRKSVPAVIGEPEIPVSVLQTALKKKALVMQLGADYYYLKQMNSWSWHADAINLLDLPLPVFQGEHQYRNAAAVIRAVTALQSRLPISETAIREGLLQAKLNGRFQYIAGEIPVLLDVAHNPQAAETLFSYLQDHNQGGRIHAIFAMMKDKDIPGVLSIMKAIVHAWYLCPLKNPRATPEVTMQEYFQRLAIANLNSGFRDFEEAYTTARLQALPGDMILIFGSFFLVSEYFSYSQKR
jgi:dihydrofolate synthase / folylpolyglutamate synthase